jgi:methylthioribose-1-phosphate isomerase
MTGGEQGAAVRTVNPVFDQAMPLAGTPIRSVTWIGGSDGGLRLLDQSELPGRETYLMVRTVDELADAVRRLVVRGAPALGAAGAYGVAVALQQGRREGWNAARLDAEIERIRSARPTAVNLSAAVREAAARIGAGTAAVLAYADGVVAADERANRTLSRLGADWVLDRLLRRVGERPVRVMTHCNTGAVATAAWGTALGVVRELHGRARLAEVRVNETRPLLQGSRLTAWELGRDGIPYVVQVDGAAASAAARGLVDVAVVGADRVAANGDTANKIGTLGVALACRNAGVPFVVAAPWTSVDLATPDGGAIRVEQRPPEEVLGFGGHRVAPAGAAADNPAFDVTPARLIDAVVTERGIVEPAAHPAAATSALAELDRG